MSPRTITTTTFLAALLAVGAEADPAVEADRDVDAAPDASSVLDQRFDRSELRPG